MSSDAKVTFNMQMPKAYKEMLQAISRKWSMKPELVVMEWIEENYKTTFKK